MTILIFHCRCHFTLYKLNISIVESLGKECALRRDTLVEGKISSNRAGLRLLSFGGETKQEGSQSWAKA